MFTGIIKEIGIIEEIEELKTSKLFKIKCNSALIGKKIDESIAVNGVCVTIIEKDDQSFKFSAISETLEKSNLNELEKGSEVNLEPALTLAQGIDGHLVQGHVDNTAEIKAIKENRLIIESPKDLVKYIAHKGSITINGVSLTVSKIEEGYFAVELIPHTQENTNLGKLKKGDRVNLEIDLIARYLEGLLNQKEQESKYEFLKDRNLI
jgi:riboflavin synthase